MASRTKLVIITALTCGACHRFKANVLPELLSKLGNRVETIQVEFKTTNPDESLLIKNGLPRELVKFIGFFPSIILLKPHGAEKEIEIYGAEKKSSTGRYGPREQVEMTLDAIYRWIIGTLKSSGNSSTLISAQDQYVTDPIIPTSKTREKYADWDPWLYDRRLQEIEN